MVKIKDLCACIEEFAPLCIQESWDNSGLIVGNPQQEVNKVLLTIDVTKAVVDEAIEHQAQMIISHHPVIMSGIKKLNGHTDTEKAIVLAIKNDIAIYAAHTNVDVAYGGVSHRMAAKLGLADIRILSPMKTGLQKLVTFIPNDYFVQVREAIFRAGAGHAGNYDSCGFSVEGKGTFCPLENAHPFAGQHGKLQTEPETRFETIFPAHQTKQVLAALLDNHPYEEVAYDLYALQNRDDKTGLGVIGTLTAPLSESHFLQKLKDTFLAPVIRHTNLKDKEISKVALCGGSGSSLLELAVRNKADVFVTADFKYHQFAEAEENIFITDIGHFESEQFTKEIFHELLMKKFPNFAIHFSKVKTNPINYS